MAENKPGPIAQRIIDLLEERGMSRAELSRRTGISQQAMQKWWKGMSEPTLGKRRLVAHALEVSLSRLLDEEQEAVRTQSDIAVEQYIASPMGRDLDEIERAQLRLCVNWVEGSSRPMEPREVHIAAELIRSRMRGLATAPTPLNPRGSTRARKLKR